MFSPTGKLKTDLIFIDNSDAVSDCLVLPPIADHSPTLLQLQLNVMSLSPNTKDLVNRGTLSSLTFLD